MTSRRASAPRRYTERVPHERFRAADVLDRLAADVRRDLGPVLIGLYVYGSLLTDDFDPRRSDVDVLALLSRDLTDEELERLRASHAALVRDHPAWNDRVEVEYVSTAALAEYRDRPRRMGRISPGEPLHFVEANAHYVLNWYLARRGAVLFGPSPEEVLPDITAREFVQVVVAHARAWPLWVEDMRSAGAQAYAVLSLCRALYAVRTGEQPSKKRAGLAVRAWHSEWASLIDWALAVRYGEAADASDRLRDVREFVRQASDRVQGEARSLGRH